MPVSLGGVGRPSAMAWKGLTINKPLLFVITTLISAGQLRGSEAELTSVMGQSQHYKFVLELTLHIILVNKNPKALW